MLSRVGAAAIAVVMVMAAPGCDDNGGDGGDGGDEAGCIKPVLTAEPGRVVDEGGVRSIELVGRISHNGKGLAGAELSFSYNHRRDNGAVEAFTAGERTTDASGAAVFRQPLADVASVARISGPIQANWRLGLESWFTVGEVDYCDTAVDGTLPIDQLPAQG